MTGPATQAAVPAIDLNRECSTWTILRNTGKLYRDNPWLFVLLAAAIIAAGADLARRRQLETLLVAARASAQSMGAELLVVGDDS